MTKHSKKHSILFRVYDEDNELIRKAAEALSLGHTVFCRTAVVERARKLINELDLKEVPLTA